MRILFLTHYFTPEGNAPASRTHEHCRAWVEAGHEVTVITAQPNVPNGVVYPGYKNRLWPTRETIEGIQVVRVWTFIAPNAGSFKRVLSFLSFMFSAVLAACFVKRPNVIIATSPQFFCGWAGVFASWLRWRPFVLEIRDIWPESIAAVGAMKEGLAYHFLQWLEKRMYLAATKIVTVGEGYKARILERAPQLNNITVITNGVSEKLFRPRPKDASFLAEWQLQNRFVCSYIGTIGMAHGLEIVVKAARRLKEMDRHDIAFLLVGDGANRAPLEQQIRDEQLEDWVTFTGRLPKEKMSTVLASSDAVLVHLSGCDLFETVIPSKIFETMAMNRPLIMGVRGEAATITAASGSALEIEPDNDEQLVEAVRQLADNPQLVQQLSASGREFVLANYSREKLAARFQTLLEETGR